MAIRYARSLGWLIAAGLSTGLVGQSSVGNHLKVSPGNISVLDNAGENSRNGFSAETARSRTAKTPNAERRAHAQPLNNAEDPSRSGVVRGVGPVNDECANATQITSGTDCVPVTSDMTGATQSLAPATCSGFTSTTANDVWYTFTATGTATAVGVGGFGDAATGLDPVLEIFSGTCGALTSLGCMDTSLRAGTEVIQIPTTIGATYYYRIYYWDYGTAQTEFGYATCVVGGTAGTAPANDECDNAAPITPGATCVPTQANMEGATQSLPPSTCSTFTSTTANDVWYVFTATGTTATVGVGGGGDATTGLDPIVEVYSGTCGNLTSLGCMDSSLRAGVEAIDIATTIGTTYYYRIYYWDYGTAQTVFDYSTCVVSIGGGPTPPNDLCGNVIPANLSVGGTVTFTGDNTNATVTGDFDPGSTITPAPTVWHSFTTTECTNVVVSYCNTSPAFQNVWIFLSQSCPVANDFVLGAFENATCGPNYTVSYFNLPAGTWYLPVLQDTSAIGAYSIDVSATACASPGNYCEAGAVSLQFEKISNVTFGTINNTSTSAAGFEDFTAQSTDVVGGTGYPLTVTISGGYATDQVLAWIDWDHNSIFDAGELMMSSALGVGPHSTTVNVPLTAVPGPTRMRIRLHDTYVGPDYQNTPNAAPCDTSTFGQVEDYTVDMIGIITGIEEASGATWSVFPNPSNGDLSIRYGGESTKVNVEVMDLTGRLVYSELRLFNNNTLEQFALAGKLATGTYVLRLNTDRGTEEQRIMVR